MLRRALALGLVCCWIALSGVDMLEDLELPFKIEFERSSEIPGPSSKRPSLAHDMAEGASASRRFQGDILPWIPLRSSFVLSRDFFKTSQLHKYHHVFLI